MRALWVAGLLTLFGSLTAEAETRIHVVAANFEARGQVLELDIPPEMDGVRFAIGFENNYSPQYIALLPARAGRHAYEMRHFPGWRGTIKYVAVTLTGVQGRVKKPSLWDELDIFSQPERITPSTMNVLTGHTLFARPWNDFLLFAACVSAVVISRFEKKPLALSLALGFLVAWGLLDLRTILDHAVIVHQKERFGQGMPPLTDMKVFADRASAIIRDGTWDHGPLEVGTKLLRYRLAEHQFRTSGSTAPPAFRITNDAADGPVLLRHGRYVLAKNQQR